MSQARILVVEDNDITRKMIRVALQAEGHEVLESPDARTALRLFAERPPDLVLQDVVLPDESGFALVRKLRAQPHGDVPIIALTGYLLQREGQDVSVLTAAFDDILVKPVGPAQLVAAVRGFLPSDRSTGPGGGRRVLLVDDDPMTLGSGALRFRSLGFEVTTARDGAEALERARENPPDAILSDVLMPNMDGFRLCQAVRADPALARTPVVLASAHYVEEGDRELALRSGASMLVPRTPDHRGEIEALLTSLDAGARPLAAGACEPMSEWDCVSCVLPQHIDRQAALGLRLAQRCSLQSLLLSVIAYLSDVWARREDLESALGEALDAVLDVGGVSRGAVYLSEDSGARIRLTASCGFGEPQQARLNGFYGREEMIRKVVETCDLLVIPSDAVPADAAREVLEGAEVGSALLVPLVFRDDRIGALFLGADVKRIDPRDWIAFARATAVQIGQSIGISRTLHRLFFSERRYRTLLENANDGIFILSREGMIVETNARAEEIHGRPREEIVGRRFTEFIDPEQAVSEAERFRRLLEQPGLIADNVIVPRPDGRRVVIDVSARMIDVGAEQLVLATARDVTERTLAGEALRASEAKYRSLIENIPDVIWTSDATGHTTFISPNVARVFGFTAGEVMEGGADIWLGRIHPEDRRHVEQAHEALVADGRLFDVEYRIQRKDGAWIWLHDRAVATQERDGVLQVDGIFSDVTERKRLEQQFLQAQKMEAIGQLTGGIAHDFNNILSVILANCGFLLHDLGDGDPRREDVEAVQHAGERAAALTRQLLAFSRKQVLAPVVLDLNEVVARLDKMLRRLIGEDVDLVVDLAPELGTVRADVGQVEQVLMNLAVNARDAMPGGGRLTITTANVDLSPRDAAALSLAPGPCVALTVADTGCGMDPGIKRHVFEPFFTTKERGRGTGLGLSTCYGIVKQSGGTIAVESEPNHGAVFTVFLPRVSEAPEVVRPASPAGVHGSETILLVEDDERVRAVARRILASNGYRVLVAGNGKEALDICAKRDAPIDLILSDVVIPDLSGFDLAARVQKDRSGIRALFMSGYTDHPMLKSGVPRGMNFLQKPFTPITLATKVREVLDAGAETAGSSRVPTSTFHAAGG
jgi:PAS domain S-box-containing protein